MLSKIGTVAKGPAVWRGKVGPILIEEDGVTVILLYGKDDGGWAYFEVRLPSAWIKTVEPPADGTVH